MSRKLATSVPLPGNLILVTKPNIHGGPARKKAQIVICGNFQDVHSDEFIASKTPGYPSLRMALSRIGGFRPAACGCCWYLSTNDPYQHPVDMRVTIRKFSPLARSLS